MAALEAEGEIMEPDVSASGGSRQPTTTVAGAFSQQPPLSSQPTAQNTAVPLSYPGAPDEFEGDRNPRTGEIGGPKKEPLRWGSNGDWSYNGRVTDF